jgi:hypothetical protein
MKRQLMAAIGAVATLVVAVSAPGATIAQADSGGSTGSARLAGQVHRIPGPTVGSVAQAEQLMGEDATLNLIAHGIAFLNPLDADPPGFSPGDVYLFRARLFDEQRTRVVGSDAEHCEVGFDTYSCQITVKLFGRGKIQADGAFFEDNVIAVTGGTGEFVGTGGELHVFLLKGHQDELHSYQLTS